ncbi:sugar ABC transporter permease [Georgenia sp. EYE_87]|uniref:carbohydrate ABC transporter permease n=1 Tax=Georgenia sp. EYE_87 TaxID=2853448 RepID=UPI0020067811|nr:sugar ABC transporter permease [Georgenia sp. EYE_87]MCK6210128.1 sugar ABC transporter permease [Georgenia sp. EYE_87]
MTMRVRRRVFMGVMLAPALLLVLVLGVYPMVETLRLSFYEYDLYRIAFAGTPFVGLDNFRTLFQDDAFLRTLANTLTFGLLVTTALIVVGLLIAHVLNSEIRGRVLLRTVSIMPWFVPGVVAAAVWVWILSPAQSPINQLLHAVGLIQEDVRFLADTSSVGTISSPLLSISAARIWNGLPLAVMILLAGLQSISKEVYEAAKIDGASPVRTLFSITIPMMMPTISVLTALVLIGTVGHFELVYLMTGGGPANLTNTLAVYSYQEAFTNGQFGLAGAASSFILVISAVIGVGYILADRRANR